MYPFTSVQDGGTAVGVVAAAALLHAGFQLAVSVLTSLSGHALGQKRSHGRLVRLMSGYIIGNALTVGLLLCAVCYVMDGLLLSRPILWAAVAVIGVMTGLLVLLTYHRSPRLVWLPADMAAYLHDRTRRTKSSAEAAALGIMTALAELPFLLAPFLFVAMILRGNPDMLRLSIIGGYMAVVVLPLAVTFLLIGAGHKVSALERWREEHSHFLQWVCGLGLVILSGYCFSLYYLGSIPGVI